MAVKNNLVQQQKQRLSFSNFLMQDAARDQINKVLGGPEGQKFITSIISAVNATPALEECTNASIFSAAMLGAGLKLSPSPQLGNYYMVPFKDKNKGMVAQFVLGYKGYIQLAIRSGEYKRLNVMAIKEGELIHFNPLEEDIEVKLIEDEEQREQAPTAGYYAFFELSNGYRKAIYWSKAKMEQHALKYSAGYKGDKERGTKYTFWSKDFDGMAYKTMLRQLISKWGIMSIEMQRAVDADTAVINEDGTRNYVGYEDPVIEAEVVEPAKVAETPAAAPAEVKAEGPANTQDPAAVLFG